MCRRRIASEHMNLRIMLCFQGEMKLSGSTGVTFVLRVPEECVLKILDESKDECLMGGIKGNSPRRSNTP